jgi:hypothetical protein
LGCLNGLFLAELYPQVGKLIDRTHDYTDGIMLAGVPPLVAFVAIWFFWNPRKRVSNDS